METLKTRVILLGIFFLTNVIISQGQNNREIKFGIYLQEIKAEIQLPQNAISDVIKQYQTGDEVTVVTSNGVYKNPDGKWINMDDKVMADGLMQQYIALENQPDRDKIIFSGLFAIGFILEDGDNWLLRELLFYDV